MMTHKHIHLRNVLALLCLLATASVSAQKYNWEDDLHHRLLCDFTQDKQEVVDYISRFIPDVTEQKLQKWEASGALEYMELDGQKRYFHAAARNLFRIDTQCQKIWRKAHPGEGYSETELADMKNLPQIIRDAPHSKDRTAQARRMRVTYTISIPADVVPEGEKVRCWMPFPHREVTRQSDIELISTSPEKYKISDSKSTHSTLYMEQKAQAGQPTVFREVFEYTSRGQWFALDSVKPYDTKSALYRKYTAERLPHIAFTPQLRALADSLTHGIECPVERARSIFTYINNHYPWASAREYSTIPCIPMYVLQNRHGDCGQVSLLFITLCRLSGIPAHFQSGFMMHPRSSNLHDWAEIYFEGIGWVPVDQSFGIPSYAHNDAEKYFFLGGIDSWRLVVNTDYGMPLSPKKKYPRSETVDFQRGEVEWRGGNLYFDQWEYNWEIEYLD